MSDEAKKPEKVDLRELEVQAMRLKAVSMAPYLSTALWSMHPVCRPGLRGGDKGGMAVDKYWRLYYDPTVFDVWTIDECAAVLLHEVWHLLRDHVGRAGKMGLTPEDYSIESQAKHKVWNLAADCEINDDLREEKTGLPDDLIYPDDTFGFENNLMAEIYFDLLWKDLKDDVKALQKMIDDGSIFGGPNGQDGSGATGQISRWEVGSSKGRNGKDGDADIPEGVPVGESELLRKQVAQEISKQAGTAPGFASRWADEQLHPQIDWRRVLAGAIRGAIMDASGAVDYTYQRPSRRQASPAFKRIVMPSLRGPRPRVQIAIDTSGSMSKKDLEVALGEIKGIMESTQAEVTVFAVDAEVHTKQKVYSAKEIKLIGGGGTDMGKGLEVMGKDRAPIAIVITDGFTPWPEKKPKGLNKIIVALVLSERWGSSEAPPDYTTVVETWNKEDES